MSVLLFQDSNHSNGNGGGGGIRRENGAADTAAASPMVLVRHDDVATLEHLLCLAESARAAFAERAATLARDLDAARADARHASAALALERAAWEAERAVLRQRCTNALRERNELGDTIASLETDFAALRAAATLATTSHPQRAASHQIISSNSGDGNGSARPMGHAELWHSGRAGGEAEREEQLLGLLDTSAVVFAEIQLRLRSQEAEIAALRAGASVAMPVASPEVASAGCFNREERDAAAASATHAAVERTVAVQRLQREECRDRQLLALQSDATLFQLAFLRCRGDAARVAKAAQLRVDAVVADVARERRLREGDLRAQAEVAAVEAERRLEAQGAEHAAERDALRKRQQQLAMANELLRRNADAWRTQSDERERERFDELETLRRDAGAATALRDAALRESELRVAALTVECAQLRESAVVVVSGATPRRGRSLAAATQTDLDGTTAIAAERGAASGAEFAAERERAEAAEQLVVALEQQRRGAEMARAVDVAALRYEIDSLQLRLASGERQREFAAAEARSAQEQLAGVAADRDSLATALQRARDEHGGCADAMGALSSERDSLRGQLGVELRTNAALEQTAAELEAALSAMASDVVARRAQLDDSAARDAARWRRAAHAAQRTNTELEEQAARREFERAVEAYVSQVVLVAPPPRTAK